MKHWLLMGLSTENTSVQYSILAGVTSALLHSIATSIHLWLVSHFVSDFVWITSCCNKHCDVTKTFRLQMTQLLAWSLRLWQQLFTQEG